jgi:hypothetical protein
LSLAACDVGVSDLSAASEPDVTLIDAATLPDHTFRMVGSGWTPHTRLTVYFRAPGDAASETPMIVIDTDEWGAFEERVECPDGSRWLTLPLFDVVVRDWAEGYEVVRRVGVAAAQPSRPEVEATPDTLPVLGAPIAPEATAVPGPVNTPTRPAQLTLIPANTLTPTPKRLNVLESQWQGEYFNNVDLSGPPTFIRSDGESGGIHMEWHDDSPAEFVSADAFSVRWTRSMSDLLPGTYRLYLRVDDSARVYIDDFPVLDSWNQAVPGEPVTSDVWLALGDHQFRIEMVERTGEAFIEFRYERLQSYKGWKGEYYANPDLEGTPVIVRDDSVLNFDWGSGSPDGAIPVDGFSAQWTRAMPFEQTGQYILTARMDGGVRVHVDGVLQIDKWNESEPYTRTVTVSLEAGWHTVSVAYRERNGNALAEFVHQPVVVDGWRGEYFDNPNLDGLPVVVRGDGTSMNLDFAWGNVSPFPEVVPADNFSVRWTRSLAADTEGMYRISMTMDDGVRLFVGGTKIIDEWHDSNSNIYSGPVYLTRDDKQIRVEYFERLGVARVRLEWGGRISNTPTPTVTALP